MATHLKQNSPHTTRARISDNVSIAGLLALMLASCNADHAATGQLENSTIDLGIPEKIRQVSAVNQSAVSAIANVNSVDYPMERNGERFRATVVLENVTSVAVNLRFAETLDTGYVLNLARHSQVTRAVGSNDLTIEFFESGFDTQFDDDNDGINNLQERELGTDPLVVNDPPTDQRRDLTLQFTLPPVIPNPIVTQPIVTFEGTPRVSRRIGNSNDFTVNGSISALTNVVVEVLLTQQTTTGRAVMATSISTISPGPENTTLELSDGDFDFSRDDDGDGQTNIEEVRNNTDPFSAN